MCGSCGQCPRCRRAAYQREWLARLTPEERKAKRASRDPEKVRVQDRNKQRKRRRLPGEKRKRKARKAAWDAVRLGRLPKGICQLDGPACAGRLEMHHDDYDKPLDVTWLCKRHHDERHQGGAA